jgi:hypothetical protein
MKVGDLNPGQACRLRNPGLFDALNSGPAARKVQTAGEAAERESELHEEIAAECRRRGWLVFHGSMAHRARRTPGEPDFEIVCEWPRVLLVECKARDEKPSRDQQAVAAHARKLGHVVHLVRSVGEFKQIADGPPRPAHVAD